MSDAYRLWGDIGNNKWACTITSLRNSTRHEEPRTSKKNRAKKHWVARDLAETFLLFTDTKNHVY